MENNWLKRTQLSIKSLRNEYYCIKPGLIMDLTFYYHLVPRFIVNTNDLHSLCHNCRNDDDFRW